MIGQLEGLDRVHYRGNQCPNMRFFLLRLRPDSDWLVRRILGYTRAGCQRTARLFLYRLVTIHCRLEVKLHPSMVFRSLPGEKFVEDTRESLNFTFVIDHLPSRFLVCRRWRW